jgi:hypothetical protein
VTPSVLPPSRNRRLLWHQGRTKEVSHIVTTPHPEVINQSGVESPQSNLTLSQLLHFTNNTLTMPKISRQRCQHGQDAPRSAPILSKARKVSFEENSQDESSSPSSSPSPSPSQSPSLIPRTSPCRNMTRLLERKPTSSACLSELADMSVEASLNVTASQEMSSSSLWGQFVDVVPDDSDYRDVQYETCISPYHSSPAYHPYLHPSKSARKSSDLLLPSKNTKTKKLQKRALMDVEGALEQLRF